MVFGNHGPKFKSPKETEHRRRIVFAACPRFSREHKAEIGENRRRRIREGFCYRFLQNVTEDAINS